MGLMDKAKGAAAAAKDAAVKARAGGGEVAETTLPPPAPPAAPIGFAPPAAPVAPAPVAQPAAAQAPMGDQPLLQVKSHDEGRNADVFLYANRIERILQAKRSAVMFKAKQDTEVIPLRSVSSVQAKKDGRVFTKVTIYATGNTIEFRMTHDAAQQFKNQLTQLIVG